MDKIPYLGKGGYVPKVPKTTASSKKTPTTDTPAKPSTEKKMSLTKILMIVAMIILTVLGVYLLIRFLKDKEQKALSNDEDSSKEDKNLSTSNSQIPQSDIGRKWITPEGKVFDMQKYWREVNKRKNDMDQDS